jgi:hypothetical protein
MDTAPVVSMDALWPDPAEQRRAFEVVVRVPREDSGEPLIPRALPAEVLGCWSATTVTVSATVLASRPSRAVAAVEALVPELAAAAGAAVTVRDAVASSDVSASQPGLRISPPIPGDSEYVCHAVTCGDRGGGRSRAACGQRLPTSQHGSLRIPQLIRPGGGSCGLSLSACAECSALSVADAPLPRVVNKTPLAAETNRSIGGEAPTKYLPRVKSKLDAVSVDVIITTHGIDTKALRSDDFYTHFAQRKGFLLGLIEAAMGKKAQREEAPADVAELAAEYDDEAEDTVEGIEIDEG